MVMNSILRLPAGLICSSASLRPATQLVPKNDHGPVSSGTNPLSASITEEAEPGVGIVDQPVGRWVSMARQAAVISAVSLTWAISWRSEEHTPELQSLRHLVCRLLLEKKK